MKIKQLISNILEFNFDEKYTVILGKSVSGSARSPILWNSVFSKINSKTRMHSLDVENENLEDLFHYLQNDTNFIGGAIAFPYKEKIAELLGQNITPQASSIGAVNCLFRNSKGELFGTNTDGQAALDCFLEKFPRTEENINILQLGCGGAGKAVAAFFANHFPNYLIAVRSPKSISDFAKKISAETIDINNISYECMNVGAVINCTDLGSVPAKKENLSILSDKQISSFSKDTVFYDIIYDPEATLFIKLAKESGFKTVNGICMNLKQAILGFSLCFPHVEMDLISTQMSFEKEKNKW